MLKLLHEVDQGLYTFNRHCVIDARAHTTNRPMALDVLDTSLLGLGNEFCIKVRIAGNKRNVHDRAIFYGSRGGVELSAIQIIVGSFALASLIFFIPSRPPCALIHLNTLPQI